MTRYEEIMNMNPDEFAEWVHLVANSETRVTVCNSMCVTCHKAEYECVDMIKEYFGGEV